MQDDSVVGADPSLRVAGRPGETGALADAARAAASSTRVAAVGSTGVTGLEPLVLASVEGETAFYDQPSSDRVREIVASLEDGDLPDDPLAVTEHDPETTTLPVPSGTPLSVGRRQVLARCGWVAPASVTDAGADGLVAFDDGETIREGVAAAGVRGRGRGDASTDEPVVGTWDRASEADGDPVVVVNGNEHDEAVAGDATLLSGVPIEVLDGALAVAAAVDASDVVVAVPGDGPVADRVVAARDALIEDRSVDAEVDVVTGPDLYRVAEPTMALEAMEGADRIEARRQPPGPAEYGLYGRPTVVHTPRTLAQVREALARPEAFASGAADPGTRLVTVTGEVDAAATVELPTDASLSTALSAVEHGAWRFACVGGQFGGLTRELDVPASAPAMAGAELGTNGGIELFDEDACAVATAGYRARFAREENCGRCVPCREGTVQLTELLRDVYDGSYADGKIRELTRVMRESSLCAFGREATRPVETAMEEFESEFHAHANGRCPTGTCEEVEP